MALSILLFLSLTIHVLLLRKLSFKAKIPVLLFSFSYFWTTCLGAILVTFDLGYDAWSVLGASYVNFKVLKPLGHYDYFAILFLPLVIPQFISLCFYAGFRRIKIDSRNLFFELMNRYRVASVSVQFLAFGSLSLLCLFELVANGLTLNFFNIGFGADYADHIAARRNAMQSLSMFYFGIVYVGLPVLSCYMLSTMLMQKKTLAHRLNFFFSFSVIAYFILSTVQKAPLLILLIYYLVTLLLHRAISIKGLLVMGVAAFSFLGFAYSQVGAGDGSGLFLAFYQTIMRMGASFPFYYSIFPDQVEFVGTFGGGRFIGIGATGTETVLVSDYMDLVGDHTGGNVPISSSMLDGYILGGFLTLVISQILFGVYLIVASRLCELARSPLAVSATVYFVLWSYYLSQSTIAQILGRQSWGYLYVLLSLVILVGLQALMRLFSKNNV